MATKKTKKAVKSRAKSTKIEKKVEVPASSAKLKAEKSELEGLAEASKKPEKVSNVSDKSDRTLTVGELLLTILVIGVGFFIGYRKYLNDTGSYKDDAKYYKSEIMAIKLNNFYEKNNYYPTIDNLKDDNWIGQNDSDLVYLQDDGFDNNIGDPGFSYDVYPEGCNNQETMCDGYKLDINTSSSAEVVEQVGGTGKDHATGTDQNSTDNGEVDLDQIQ